MLVWSSNTVTAAVPRPRQPTLPGPLKSSGASNSASVRIPMLMPPGIAPFAERHFHQAWLIDVAADAVELRSVAAGVAWILRIGRHAHRLEPIRAAADDMRHARQRFDVVD